MNQKIIKQLLEQLQQETKDPQDIGNINLTNVIIWMKKEPYEETTIKRVLKELRHWVWVLSFFLGSGSVRRLV